MVKKRLIGVICVKDGWSVQSFAYNRYLPLGKPTIIAENLDRWGADEIMILSIDRSINGLGPDFELMKQIGNLGLSTPISYGGGIRNYTDAITLVNLGAERLCIDWLFQNQPTQVQSISDHVGSQAIILSLPCVYHNHVVMSKDYCTGKTKSLTTFVEMYQQNMYSEILLIDALHEGLAESFDSRLVKADDFSSIPIIAFGGISNSEQIERILESTNVNAIAIGNALHYQEHAIQRFKNDISHSLFRKAQYSHE